MLDHLIALLAKPDAFRCTWRDGELYIEPVAIAEEERERALRATASQPHRHAHREGERRTSHSSDTF